MATMTSKVVPTEYDVWKAGRRWVVSDDLGRKFRAFTQARAYAKAERAQNPSDPIHGGERR